ncbi:hypothetical protein KAU51_04305 [Candidatus Parcubacteria bacterium]|nr:hypothetical protein [Candidatus Parcubacteria bacterium]
MEFLTKKRVIVLILLLSLGANCWYFGNEELKKREQQAFNNGIIYTFQKAIEVGEVSLKTEQGKIILEVKK